jgi:hypothetical protein
LLLYFVQAPLRLQNNPLCVAAGGGILSGWI